LFFLHISNRGEHKISAPPYIIDEYPNVHWKGIAGMRDIISHGYHGIDLETIWAFMTEEIPTLKDVCELILRGLEP